MSIDTLRWLFATLCAMGFAAIVCVSLFEIGRQRRGASGITLRHFRWRMFSAVLWMFILGSFAYATIFVWPTGNPKSPQYQEMAQRFIGLTGGAMALFFIALFLMFIDFKMTLASQREQRRKFESNLSNMAQAEITRQLHKNKKSTEDKPEEPRQ